MSLLFLLGGEVPSGEFSPLSLPLLQWLDASDTSTISHTAGAVTQINDKSGNGYHETSSGSNSPTTGTRTVNGLNTLDFDGTDDFLLSPSGLYTASNADNVIVTVTQLDSSAATQCIVGGTGTGNARWRLYPCDTTNTNISGSNINSTSTVARATITHSTTAPRINMMVKTGTQCWVSQSGVFGSPATAANVTLTALNTGRMPTPTQYFNGMLCEKLVLGPNVTNSQLEQLGQYLLAKWGAPWDTTLLSPVSALTGKTSMVVFGDSISAGQNATTTNRRWANLVANSLRIPLTNKGTPGTVLQNSNGGGGSPLTNNGRDRYVADLTGAAKKDICIINYGLNDLRYTGGGDMSLANFSNDYQEIITGLLGAGYAATDIVLCSPYWIPDAGYSSGSAGFTGSNRTIHEQYVDAVRTLAYDNETYYADVYAYMRDNGGASLIGGDNIHPEDAGHLIIAQAVFQAEIISRPFPLTDDGLGYTIKLTLPVNEAGALSGTTDAYEVFTSNSPNYNSPDPVLEDYSHPTYFIQSNTAYRFASPIRPGAYTSSNTNGPARSEFRHERNYGPTERIRFRSKIKFISGNPSSKCTCVQIHRLSGDPVIKGVLQVDAGGTTWKFRALVKLTDGADDESFNDGLGSEVLAENLTFNTEYSIEYDFDPVAETLKVWFNTANTNSPTHTFTGVEASGLDSYIKPGGVYPSDNGTGSDSDLWVVDLTAFDLVDNSGNLVVR